MSSPSQTAQSAPGTLPEPVADFYKNSRAAEFGCSPDQFIAMLEEVARKHAGGASFESFCAKLRIEDLVLTRACAGGNEQAWEVFLSRFREKLYEVARQITRDDAMGRELADSVYADLFGTRTRDGVRVSKLLSYSGRGSLEGWLRTVLAQEFVNNYRKQRRLVSLEEEEEGGAQFTASEPATPQSVDPVLERATDDALKALSAEERFILASYFLENRTLSQIARALSVHESTISRKVEKLTKNLRKQILKNLVSGGMSRRQAEEALSTDVRDLTVDIRSALAQDSVANAFSEKGAKAGEGGS
jgi:RNA polymerase sigma-70 factor (ECF subfamily)